MTAPSPATVTCDVRVATPDDFDELVLAPRDLLVVAYFWGPQCPNCEVYARFAPELYARLAGEPVRVVKVDAYEHPGLARRFGLFGIPAFVLFRDGIKIGRMSEFRGSEFWLGVVRENLPPRSSA